MGRGLVAGFCAAPLVPSVPHALFDEGRSGKVTGPRRPRGWLQLTQPLSTAETTPPATITTASLSARTATAPATRAQTTGDKRQRHRRRSSTTRLHSAGSPSSSSSSSSASSPLSSSSSSPSPASLPTDKFPLPPPPPPPPPHASAPLLLTPEAFSGDGGAEWAGWECRFSGKDGKPVAVPEDYVPESLREWDVEVWGFETLTSEQRRRKQQQQQGADREAQNKEGREGDSGSDCDVLYRKRGRVYPETGCALDNLTLEENAQTSPLACEGIFAASFPAECSTGVGGGHVLGKKSEGPPSLQLEIGLLVPGVHFSDPSMAAPTGEGRPHDDANEPKEAASASEGEEEDWSRVRVEVRVDSDGGKDGGDGGKGAAAAALGPTVTVTRERRYRGEFDDGALYKGGGLDSQKLRQFLRSKCFAESESAPASEAFAGKWTSGRGCWKLFHAAPQDTPSEDLTDAVEFRRPETSHTGIQTLLLRGGLTVRSGPWLGGDGGSSSAADRWGPAGSSFEKLSQRGGSGEEDLWAVEVGWFVGDGAGAGAGGQDGESTLGRRREVLTTLLDARTMAPLGAWKGGEERVSEDGDQ